MSQKPEGSHSGRQVKHRWLQTASWSYLVPQTMHWSICGQVAVDVNI